MTLSELTIRRPVLAVVANLLLIAFGLVAFTQLPLRELPDVDPPIVSITTTYRGAAADVVESQITQIIEEQLSGIEGLDLIEATSSDGRSNIRVEFDLSRDLDAAANDVRTAVDRVTNRLPQTADPPQVAKTDVDSEPILWLNLTSDRLSRVELTDYADRILTDRLSAIDGVASVRVGGGMRPAMRVWLDPEALAARGLTPDDVDQALRAQNVELPAGQIEAAERSYTLRVARGYLSAEDFRRLPVGRAADGRSVRLEDVARVERAAEDDRRMFRGNGENQIGIGIVRQSKSNALDVANAVKAEVVEIEKALPEGMTAVVAFDSSVFIAEAINGVWRTMGEAIILTLVVIFLFLGTLRAAFVPAATIPVCLIAIFLILSLFGFSLNLITLLALVLVIGLVVDDAIVVLENIQRRVDLGEPPLIAAERGTRQVQFAVIATSAVLVSVFLPLLFTGGFIGRLFVELAATVAGAVIVSAFVALTLTPVMASWLLRPAQRGNWLMAQIDRAFQAMRTSYRASVEASLKSRWSAFAVITVMLAGAGFMFTQLPRELTPREDRGNMLMQVSGPDGAGFEYMRRVMLEAEPVLMEYVDSGVATRILLVAPRFQDQGSGRFNGGFGRIFLAPWGERPDGNQMVDEMNAKLSQIPGAQFRVIMPPAINASGGGPGGGDGVSIVVAGSDYRELAAVAERVIARLRDNPDLQRPRMNYEPISPRVEIVVDRERAAALGVSVAAIGRTLEATTGLRRVGTFPDRGEEYDVLLQTDRRERRNIEDLSRIQVRSDRTGELVPLSNLITTRTLGGSDSLPRVNKLRAVTISASLANGYTIGEGLASLEDAVRAELEPGMTVDYTGAAKQFLDAGGAIGFAFLFALLVVYLTLAAQFESFIHPLTVMLTVPLAIAGGLFGLYALGISLNIYSQIGLIILIALAAKNGILIVEFANQLRDEGRSVRDAIVEAAELRLRPILMTSFATIAGAIPLAIASGAGAETRIAIGVVIVFGVLVATALTLFVVPVIYTLFARFTGSAEQRTRAIESFAAAEASPAE
jgi:multidrug efflux pump